MDKKRKNYSSFSKRHFRRIIANNTEIDIAGCSKPILDSYNVNTFSKDTVYVDAHNESAAEDTCNVHNNNNTMHTEITTSEDYDKYQDHNIQKNNDNCYDSIILDRIVTENYKSIIKEVDQTYDNNDDEKKLKNAIATWVVSYNIPHNACNALLKTLRQYTSYNMPMDTRTLLQTPRQTNIVKVCGGEYFHFGLHNIIKQMVLKDNDKCFKLLINIDGLPLAKSSQASLWPILCSNTVNMTVYLVGAYFGYKKTY